MPLLLEKLSSDIQSAKLDSLQTLVSSEVTCVVAVVLSVFGSLCVPLLLEKLSSDIQSAKLDSLQTLVSYVGYVCCGCGPVCVWTTVYAATARETVV